MPDNNIVVRQRKLKMEDIKEGSINHIIAAGLIYFFIGMVAYVIFNPEEIDIALGIPAQLIGVIIHLGSSYVVVKYLLRKNHINFKKIGFEKHNFTYTLGLGITGGILAAIIQFPFGVVKGITEAPTEFYINPEYGPTYILIFVLILCIASPILEEIFFRGFFYPIAKSKYKVGVAVLLVTVVWVVVHTPNNTGLVLRYICTSLLFLYIYEHGGNIGATIIAHILGNTVWYASVYSKALGII